jgi:hypothetical protein
MTSVDQLKVNPDSAKQYLLGMNEGNLDSALSGFADDATSYGIEKRDGKIYRKLHGSKAEIHTYIDNWLSTAKRGITYDIKRVVQYGDGLLIEWSDVMEGQGDVETYVNEGMLIFEFNEDGLVKHARAYQDFGPLERSPFLEK